MRYGIYARKSTEADERQAQSIEDQCRLAHELGRKNGHRVTVLLEESRSAKEPGRPEFSRMLHLIDKGEIDGIICWHPDRLSRNEMDAAAITMRLRKGILKDLQFVNYFFVNSPEGIMMLQMALSQSQYYSSKLSEDVRRGMQSKREKGWWPHRALPGYVNDSHLNKGEKTISPDPVRFPLIRKLFDHFLTGAYTGPQLLRLLNEEWGYTSPQRRKVGGEPMALSTLYRILGSPFYAGYFILDGKQYKGKHQPMVSMEEHYRARELLRHSVRIQPKKREFAYTGLIRCAGCNHLITAQMTKNRYGAEYAYYRCGDCRGQIVSEKRLNDQLMTQVDRIAVLPEFAEWAREEWAKAQKREKEETAPAMTEQKRLTLATVETQMDNLLTALTKGLISDEEYKERRERLGMEQLRLKHETEELEAQENQVREAMENVLVYISNVKLWMMQEMNLDLKKACVCALGSNFRLDGKNLLLELHPLLVHIREEYKGLEAKYEQIKLAEIGSESTKKQHLHAVSSAWSRIWGLNQTLARERHLTFPNITPLARLTDSNHT